MKLHISLLFIFCLALFSAQNKKFTYEYQYISDSTNRENISREIMILNVNKEKSYYYSLNRFISDSTMIEESKKGVMVMPLLYNIAEIDMKDLGNKKVSFETRITFSKYTVDQNVNFQ